MKPKVSPLAAETTVQASLLFMRRALDLRVGSGYRDARSLPYTCPKKGHFHAAIAIADPREDAASLRVVESKNTKKMRSETSPECLRGAAGGLGMPIARQDAVRDPHRNDGRRRLTSPSTDLLAAALHANIVSPSRR
jgi:hypothetical protein